MKLSHRCIVLRIKLNMTQARLANEIRTSQSQLSSFEDGYYIKMSEISHSLLMNLINKHVGNRDYDDLTWEEMARLKMKVNNIKLSTMATALNVPMSQISEVVNGKIRSVSRPRIDRIHAYLAQYGVL